MSNITSVKLLCEKIWELEKELGLLDFQVQGIKVWQALRMELYYDIAQSLRVLELPHTKEGAKKYKFKALASFLYSSLRYNPFLNIKKKEILIFDHPRKVLVDGQYIDIYTHSLIKELKGSEKSFEVYERCYLDRHLSKGDKCRKHLDFIRLCSKIYFIFANVTFSQQEVDQIRNLETKIREQFGVNLDLMDRFRNYVKRFRVRYTLFKKLFEWKCPSSIYVLVGYGLAPIIKAAKDRGVEVFELQHGVFSDYHLGYSFPDAAPGSMEYFPDRFLVWDDFWKNMCSLPLSHDKIEIKRFSHFEEKRREFSGIKKNHHQIVVVSQGVVGERVSEIILNNIDDLKDFKIIYKLHPGEYDRWREYPSLVRLEAFENVSIVDNNEKPLYEFLAESKYVIGVFSTALFEALGFNCHLLLLDLPGIEYMQRLIRNGRAVCVGEGKRIRDMLGVD